MLTEPPSGRDDGQRELLRHTLERLPTSARKALEILSFPHWFDDFALEHLVTEGGLDVQLALEIRESKGWGLIERWSDGAFAVIAPVRGLVLDGAALDPQSYRKRSLLFADVFHALACNGGDVFDHAESVYHRLAAEPERGAELILADGITWKSEPLFALDALERLVAGAREQQRRGFLSERAGRYTELLELYLPRADNTARAEEQVLRRLLKDESGVDLFEAELRLRLGLAVLSGGGTVEARHLFEAAKALFGKANSARGEADALRSLGRAALRADQLMDAHQMFVSARAMFNALGLTISSTHCVKALAETEFYRGLWNDAEPLFKRALSDFVAVGSYLGEANTRVVYSQLLAARAEIAAAHQHIDRATEVYDTIGHRLGLANCLKNRAVALFENEQYEQASETLAAAFESYERWGSASGRANCRLWSAACQTRLGHPEKAFPLLDEAAEAFESIGERFGQASVLREQGLATLANGQPRDALKPLQQSRANFLAVGNEVDARVAAVALGRAAVAAGLPSPFTRESLYALAVDAANTFRSIGFQRQLREAEGLIGLTDTNRAMPTPSRNFSDNISISLNRTEYRLAGRGEDYEAILRLRYKAFRSANLIDSRDDRMLAFPDDNDSHIFGVYIDGNLVSTVSIEHVTNLSQSRLVFSQFSGGLNEFNNVVMAYGFAADPHLSSLFPQIPYLTLRLWILGAEFFDASNISTVARRSNVGFYNRNFNATQIAALDDTREVWVLLNTSYNDIRQRLFHRFPFYRSIPLERRLLFDRAEIASTPLLVLPSARYFPKSLHEERNPYEVRLIA
ncbi:hypothetical protein LB523_28490 [Mesorhizobium sp. ESP-6-4]|uniref:N-acyl amino acid synthase FeeM domain-containing protein n=1 Tax=Mesorhizobium sp. ESP-6-4 TaxID=2876624 RepID=UPI001CCD9F4C|nr:hypothetical protein [Mesorhizobium sp. ESP-6-4]MBZ9662991.1 hypothetical protein [Mesorhizobium sp. ESP-6-4]